VKGDCGRLASIARLGSGARLNSPVHHDSRSCSEIVLLNFIFRPNEPFFGSIDTMQLVVVSNAATQSAG